MPSRRQALSHSVRLAALLAGAGMLAPAARAAHAAAPGFAGRTMADVLRLVGGSAPQPSTEVQLTAPDIAENGAAVQLSLATTAPGARRLLLLVEKNPAVLSAVFDIVEGVEPHFTTRVKMGQSSNVYAVAMLADGRTLFAQKDVKITLGGCAG